MDKTATHILNRLLAIETDGNRPADMRRVMRDERVAIQAAVQLAAEARKKARHAARISPQRHDHHSPGCRLCQAIQLSQAADEAAREVSRRADEGARVLSLWV